MLNVSALISGIIAEVPDDYPRKNMFVNRLEYVRQGSYYQSPECQYLSLNDIHIIIKSEILKYFDKNNYPDWVDNILAMYWEGESLV